MKLKHVRKKKKRKRKDEKEGGPLRCKKAGWWVATLQGLDRGLKHWVQGAGADG